MARGENDIPFVKLTNNFGATSARKAIPGDWKSTFTPKVKQIFKDLVGDGLIQLGYEKNNDW